MIEDFLLSWPLFYKAYIAGWLIAVLLSMAGVVVVARDQIFIGAAVSQASALGIAVALRIGDVLGRYLTSLRTDGFLATMAVVASSVAALATTRSRGGRTSHEALTGWVFLFSASVAVLIVSNSPHGTEEVHRVLVSTIIGATAGDLAVFGALGLATMILVAVAHRRLLLLATDPAMAAALGMRTELWDAAMSLWLGLVVGLSIRAAGVLYTFGCLVLPALIAASVCREMRPLFIVAPLVAIGTGALGFVLAHHYDFPPAQMTIALLCALLAVARAWAWIAGR
jgi:ABC-type Mn2+/Zn2+ transport system permease subunit